METLPTFFERVKLMNDDLINSNLINENLKSVIDALNNIVLGKDRQIKLALACLLAKGHLLIEDLPGMGKTTLAHALAKALGLNFQRVQFTSDLLPGDITGSSIYQRTTEEFIFHKGPVFSQVLLADEINRATPKSQSALLEAMEEYQVTADGKTHQLPQPFFVIATQNSFNQIGTYPLPESQLDRFLMRVSLGYPSRNVEKKLLSGIDSKTMISQLKQLLDPKNLITLQEEVEAVQVNDALYDYLQDLIDATRDSEEWEHGLSPRAGLSLLRAAKAWALLHTRDYVLPEDIQAVWLSVTEHRLSTQNNSQKANNLVLNILKTIAIPR